MPSYIGSQRPGREPFIWQADSALAAWQAALQNTRALLPIVGIGDSLMCGRKSTNFAGTSFWQRIITALKARYGDAGMGQLFCCCDSTDPVIGSPTVCDLPASVWSYSGSWSITAGGMGGRTVVSSTGGNTATATFFGSSFDLWVGLAAAGGPFTVTLDGNPVDANGVVNGSGGNPTSAGTAGPAKVFTCSGLAPAQHTLVLTIVANAVQLAGITVYNGNPGILPLRFSKSGQSVYDTIKAASFGDCVKGSIENFTPRPALVVLQHVINDVQQSNAYSIFEDGLRRFYDSAVVAGASVVHVIPYVGPQTFLTGQPRMHRAIEKIYLLAQRYGAAVVDVNMAWESLSPSFVGSTLLASDGVHPSDAGHADIAARLLSVINQ